MLINLKSGKTVNVTSVRGDKDANWNPSGLNYRVTIAINGKRASFDFWDSADRASKAEPCDLRGAAACFSSDVLAAMNCDSADEVASEFGYESPSEAYRVFRGIKSAQKKAKRLGFTEDELTELNEY